MLIIDISAALKIKQLIGQNPLRLRIEVQGGGCSGFKYNFFLDDRYDPEQDQLIPYSSVDTGKIEVVVDREALKEFLEEGTLSYFSDLGGEGFRVDNPKATQKCGCGQSFFI